MLSLWSVNVIVSPTGFPSSKPHRFAESHPAADGGSSVDPWGDVKSLPLVASGDSW